MEDLCGALAFDDAGSGVNFKENEDASKRARVVAPSPPALQKAPNVASVSKAIGVTHSLHLHVLHAVVHLRALLRVGAAACGCSGDLVRMHANGTLRHDHAQSTGQLGSQGPRCKRCTKAGVSSPSEDRTSDPGVTEPYRRTAGGVRGPVVGFGPGRRFGSLSEAEQGKGSVTLSVRLVVLDSLTPAHGEGIRQQLCWRKVWDQVVRGSGRDRERHEKNLLRHAKARLSLRSAIRSETRPVRRLGTVDPVALR